ncbi:MAG TPA: hypothetical protein PKI14_18050, partial [Fervidobacterium sp.]|nr:hypothetical protein [Fervidobacterium sp.]
GRRIEISDNQIRCYNDDGNLNGFVTNNASSQFGDWEFYDNGTLVFRVYNRLVGGGVTLRPEGGANLIIGSGGAFLRLEGDISIGGPVIINGRSLSSLSTKTAGGTYGANEQEMLQEIYDKLQELIDAINDN